MKVLVIDATKLEVREEEVPEIGDPKRLEAFQKIVGGLVEVVDEFKHDGKPHDLVANEEGRLLVPERGFWFRERRYWGSAFIVAVIPTEDGQEWGPPLVKLDEAQGAVMSGAVGFWSID